MKTQWHIEHRMPESALLNGWLLLNDESTASGRCIYNNEAKAKRQQAIAMKAHSVDLISGEMEIRLLRVTSEVVG